MWPNNGFQNNGNNFNQIDYPSSPFDGPGQQQYLPQHPFQPSMMQYENANGEGFMNGEFQPEVGLYNEGAFAQNQSASSANAQFPPQHLNNWSTSDVSAPVRSTVLPSLDNRAAELKAQLLKGKLRNSSGPPPGGMAGKASTPQPQAANGGSSLCESPSTAATTTERFEQNHEINELISQIAGPKPAGLIEMKDADNLPALPQPKSFINETSTKSKIPSLESHTKVTKPHNGKVSSNGANGKNPESKHVSSGSMSEGEILEDRTTKEAMPPAVKEAPAIQKTIKVTKATNEEEAVPRKSRHEQPLKPSTGRRESSPRRALPNHSRPQPRHLEDRLDEADPRQDRRPQYSTHKDERKPNSSEANKSPPHRRDTRDDDHGRPEVRSEKREEASNLKPKEEPKKHTLEELLPHNDDLKEWLEITGYHNEPYRMKILNRRRAIAALDAQRNALLAEMEAEERGGIPVVNGVPAASPTMLPPPIPNKVGDRTESLSKPANILSECQRERVVSNKRTHNETTDPRGEGNAKIARTNDRGSRINQEDDDYRPRSTGYDTSRRRSIDDRRDDRDSPRPRQEEGRGGRGRAISRERDVSPGSSGRKAFESRLSARGRGYEDGDDFYMRDRDRDRSRSRDRGQYVPRGGYRGRAYDPHYRGRGRGGGGRGRGDYSSQGESRVDAGSFGARIANGKPYKDTRGFDRGGKGDTRYFIVKSFNEENVMRCIEDGIWTTQVQNGPLFKEAFQTCRNVIFVFSINKSRAFQGYARMESLPGSVEIPGWQRAINWESAGAFKVKWLVICATHFQKVGHLKNALNDNLAVLIGKDGQEIEENCGRGLVELIDAEADLAIVADRRGVRREWNNNDPWDD